MKRTKCEPPEDQEFFLLLFTAVALVPLETNPVPRSSISTPGIQAHRDMEPETARMVRLDEDNPKRSHSRRQCTPGLPHQCFRSFLMDQAETQALICISVKCNLSPKKGTWNTSLLNFTLFLTLNRTLELRSR